MKPAFVDKKIVELRRSIAEVLLKLQKLTEPLGMTKEQVILRESFSMVNDPFLFVVVGDVKSGKSSFVNALLNSAICAVDPRPCTDCIQEITYGDQEEIGIRGEHLRRITRPIEILKTISIVDTPGTNSLVKNHQVITEQFIPHSDLAIFVFPANNPHTGTAWDLLSYIKDQWKRKVVFVLQQADLQPEHLAIQKASVETNALQRGVVDPKVFTTSAKWEQEGRTDKSGFEDVRQYIRNKVTGGKHLYEKLEGQIQTASVVHQGAEKLLHTAKTQLEAERRIQMRIQSKLECGTGRSSKEIDRLVERLVEKYENIANDFKKEFREGMSVGAIFKRIWPASESVKVWFNGLQKRFEARLNAKLHEIAEQEAQFFIDSIQALIRDLIGELDTIIKSRDAVAATQQVEKGRDDVVESVRDKLRDLSQNTNDVLEKVLRPAESSTNLTAGGSALGAIGIIIAAVFHIAVMDITGGILTLVGISIAGFALLWKRGEIIKQFEDGLDKGKEQLRTELKEKLAVDLRGVYREIERLFQAFFDDLQHRENQLKPQLVLLEDVKAGLLQLALDVKR